MYKFKYSAHRSQRCEQGGELRCRKCEKTGDSSAKHIEAAKKLKQNKYVGLSDDLIVVAEARLAHPDMSIEQLGETFDPPLSKSGTAYRLKKLVAAAEKSI